MVCPGISTDPWSIGDIGILDNNQLANGPGISGGTIQMVDPRTTDHPFVVRGAARRQASSSKQQASSTLE